MKIEILHIVGCPHLPAARQAVGRALALAQAAARIEEICVSNANAFLPGFAGSPTILVDGRDVEPGSPGNIGLSCRIYGNPENPGVPVFTAILAAIETAKNSEPRG